MNVIAQSIAAAAIVATTHGALAFDVPKGWRLPTRDEIAVDRSRQESSNGFTQAKADLNGDGVEDLAFVLKSTRFNGEGLWVYLSNGSAFNWVKLNETRWSGDGSGAILAMGISVEKPGVIAYACFDGAKVCAFGDRAERPKLKLIDPAINYFKMESAASIFFWSRTHKKFMRIWISD